MLIKKTFQGEIPENKIVNAYSQSLTDTYSCDYINNISPDLSNYLAKDNTTAFTPSGDYNPSTKKYVDDSISNIDLSGKEDVSNKVTSMSSSSTDTQYPSAKAVYDALNSDILHYKGHVETISDLPSTGQQSAVQEAPNIQIVSAHSAVSTSSSYANIVKGMVTSAQPYGIGATWISGSNIYSGIVRTNDKSVIKGVTYLQSGSGDSTYWLVGIRVEPNGADSTYIYYNAWGSYYYTYDDGTYQSISNKTAWKVNGSGWLFIGRIWTYTTGSNSGRIQLFSNLDDIKFIPCDLETVYYYTSSYAVSAHIKTITNHLGYTYAQNYKMFRFDPSTFYSYYVGADPSPNAKANNVYTVGSTYDVYCCNAVPQWEHWTNINLSSFEQISNKVTSLSSSSTDTQYPSAKAVYDAIEAVNGDTVPVGAIFDYNGSTAPDGYIQVADYSETETNTGLTWIDGRPIYRKVLVIEGAELPTGGNSESYNTGISSVSNFVNVTMRINVGGVFYFGSTDVFSSYQIERIMSNSISIVGNGSSTVDNTVYIIMEYTKTTDGGSV